MNIDQKLKDTYFNVNWLIYEDFKEWVSHFKGDDTKYWCKACHKSCRLSNMNITDLKKHIEVQYHKDNVAEIKNFFCLQQPST